MGNISVQTNGGAYVGRDATITGGDFVGQDKVLGNKYQTIVVTSANPSLPYYIERVQRAREMLAQGILPSNYNAMKCPLSYYQRIRPHKFVSYLSDGEIEVQGFLVNNLLSPIHVSNIQLPDGIEFIGNKLCKLGQVPPSGTVAAIRYVTLTKHLAAVRLFPQIAYRVGDEPDVQNDVSHIALPSDEASLVIPLIDRENVIDEFKSLVKALNSGQTGAWLAIVDTWGTGRSRILTECLHIVREQAAFPFEVLEQATYPKDMVNERVDPIREVLLDRFGAMDDEEALLRLVHWLDESSAPQQSVHSIALVVQYMYEGTESESHLRAVAEGLINRARTYPLLLVLDDLHNARPSALRLLQICHERLYRGCSATLLVCASYDPELCSPELCSPFLKSCFSGQEMGLENLSTENVIAFAKNWYPNLRCAPDLWESLIDFLGRRPLLIRQGLEYLQNNGYIVLKKGYWNLENDFYKDPGVRQRRSLSESGGLGMLTSEYQRLWTSSQSKEQLLAKGLRVAAAIGSEFEYTLWEQVMFRFLGCTEIESRDVCAELINKEFIVPLQDAEKPGMYRITPPTLRHKLFLEIQNDWSWTSKLHILIAEMLSYQTDNQLAVKARRAHHLLWSRVPSNMLEAFNIFHGLAFNRLNHQHLDETAIFLRRALDAAQDSQGQVPELTILRVRYELVQALDERGSWDKAYEEAREIALVCEDKALTMLNKNEKSTTDSTVEPAAEAVALFELAAEAYITTGWISQKMGAAERAFDHYRCAEHILANEVCLELSETRAYLLRKQAAWYAEQKQLELAVNHYERLLKLPALQFVPDLAQAHASYAEVLRRLGDTEAAHNQMRLAFANTDALPEGAAKDLLMSRISIQAGVLTRKSNPTQSRIYFEQALHLAQALGALNEWALAEEWLGIVNSDIDGEHPSKHTLEYYVHAAELYTTLGDMQKLHGVITDYVSLLLLAEKYDAVCQLIDKANWLGIYNREMEEIYGLAKLELKKRLRQKSTRRGGSNGKVCCV